MFKEIFNLIADYGWPAIIPIIIIFIFWRLISAFFKNKLSTFNFFHFFKKKETNNDLKFHSFFNNAEYRMLVEIPSLDLFNNKPVRQKIFKDLLYIECKAIYDTCYDIAKLDMSSWSDSQWSIEISKKVNEILTIFIKKSREEGIPDLVIERYNKWHNGSFELLFNYINLLGSESIYTNNIMRTNTFFLIMNLLLITTIADAERSLKELNGEISGLKYKGKTIEH